MRGAYAPGVDFARAGPIRARTPLSPPPGVRCATHATAHAEAYSVRVPFLPPRVTAMRHAEG